MPSICLYRTYMHSNRQLHGISIEATSTLADHHPSTHSSCLANERLIQMTKCQGNTQRGLTFAARKTNGGDTARRKYKHLFCCLGVCCDSCTRERDRVRVGESRAEICRIVKEEALPLPRSICLFFMTEHKYLN